MTETVNGVPVLDAIRDAVGEVTAAKVFGSPIVRDGLTLVPVAKVAGGGGGSNGGGFGMTAQPVGVFVIKDGDVSWRPAVDMNKVIIGGQVVAVTALLVIRAVVNARARRRRQS